MGVSDAAMGAFQAYDWPGNVRELINVIERSILLCDAEQIEQDQLPTSIRDAPVSGSDLQAIVAQAVQLAERRLPDARQEVVRNFEANYLRILLGRTGGRIGEAAAHAGVNVRSIHALMKRHGIRKEDFKPVSAAPGGQSDAVEGNRVNVADPPRKTG